MSIYASGKHRAAKARILDDKHCFELWVNMGEGGSYQKVQRALAAEGLISPLTGRAPTRQAIWFAVWKYICENQELVRPYFNNAWAAHGEILSDDEWMGMLTRHSRQAFSKKKRLSLLRLWGVSQEDYNRYMQEIVSSTRNDPDAYTTG
jgi:hypothetical protein